MKLPGWRRTDDERQETWPMLLLRNGRRLRESETGKRCERWLGGVWGAVRGRDYESGKRWSYREVVSAIRDIRRRRLIFSLLYASVLAGTLTFLKLQGVQSDESASRILRTLFSIAPVAFALYIKILIARSYDYLSGADAEIRGALSQPLSASKSIFDATLVFLLWNPISATEAFAISDQHRSLLPSVAFAGRLLMDIRSLEHLGEILRMLIR